MLKKDEAIYQSEGADTLFDDDLKSLGMENCKNALMWIVVDEKEQLAQDLFSGVGLNSKMSDPKPKSTLKPSSNVIFKPTNNAAFKPTQNTTSTKQPQTKPNPLSTSQPNKDLFDFNVKPVTAMSSIDDLFNSNFYIFLDIPKKPINFAGTSYLIFR